MGAGAQTPPVPTVVPPVRLEIDRSPEVRPDPAVRRGVLPNGLRYAVMSNKQPAQSVSMRLGVDVGSFEEALGERGIAHFLEHMAFNGTRSIPEGQLDTTFAAQGVAFGRDQNASTGFFQTVYELDLPLADAAKLDLGFRWLREVAGEMLLTPEAVNRERGVVLAEHDRSLGPERTFGDAQRAFLSPELRGPTRLPIGAPDTLRKIDAAQLRAFYDRWYRPENAAVVVVGDQPVEELERRVREAFGSWKGRGPAPVRTERKAPDLGRELAVLTRAEPQLPTGVQACRPRPRDPREPESLERWRRHSRRTLWEAIVNDRLQRRSREADPPFVGAAMGFSESYREAGYTCLSATPLNDDWRRALDAALFEIRRMELHGVTPDEVRRAVGSRRVGYQAAAASAETRRSAGIAAALLNDLQSEEREVYSRPEENLRLYDAATVDATPAEVNAAFKRDWSGGAPLITLRTPIAVDAAAVRAAWAEAISGAAPSAYADIKAAPWAYASFGLGGRVAKREVIAEPGFTRVTFANGVILNVKQVAFNRDRVSVGVRFGAGKAGLPYASTVGPELGSALFTFGGLGKHDLGELTDLFEGRRWSADLSLNDNSFDLHGETSPSDLPLQLQILTAFLSDPGFRPDADSKIATAAESVYRGLRASPGAATALTLLEAVEPGGPLRFPPKEVLAKLRASDFERALRPVITGAPLEVTVVGDVDETRAITAVAETLGALPPRTGGFARTAKPPFLHFPARPLGELRTRHEGPQEQAGVTVVWPLYVATPARRREERALELLSGVFNDLLRRRVRETLGKTYSPNVSLEMPDYADQGVLTASVETAPADAEAVGGEIRKLAAELAGGGVTTAAIEEVRKPQLDGAAKRRETNGWWFNTLSGSARNPEWLADALDWERELRSLTREDVQRAAATWLKTEPTVVYALPEPRPAASPNSLTRAPAD